MNRTILSRTACAAALALALGACSGGLFGALPNVTYARILAAVLERAEGPTYMGEK